MRSRTECDLLCILHFSKHCSNTFLERSFLFFATAPWVVSLDSSNRELDFNMFKKTVKTELFDYCYER